MLLALLTILSAMPIPAKEHCLRGCQTSHFSNMRTQMMSCGVKKHRCRQKTFKALLKCEKKNTDERLACEKVKDAEAVKVFEACKAKCK